MDHVVLLTDSVGAAELARFLKLHRPGLTVLRVATRSALDGVPGKVLPRARLIGFATDVIVPAALLERLGYGAYNFHPGPPAYPGWAPHYFAHRDRARWFGATAHRMVAAVDFGPIIGTQMFPVPPALTESELARRGAIAMIHLFRRLGRALATAPEPLPTVSARWSGPVRTRRDVIADELRQTRAKAG